MRTLFLAVIAATGAFLAAPAAAAVMLATFTGTVAQPGGPLDGNAFTAIFKYNSNVGNFLQLDGVQIRSGGSGFGAPSPMQSISMRIAGAAQYDVSVENPDEFASVGNFASAFNQYFGTTGLMNVHAEHDLRDESAGYLEYAIFDLSGFAPTGLTLDTPFAGAVSAAGTNQFSFGLSSNHVVVRSLSVGLVPTHVSVIQFGAVPEPASWAIMMIGFGLVGGVMRRHASAARSAHA